MTVKLQEGNEILDVNRMTVTKYDDSLSNNANSLIRGDQGQTVRHDNIRCLKGPH